MRVSVRKLRPLVVLTVIAFTVIASTACGVGRDPFGEYARNSPPPSRSQPISSAELATISTGDLREAIELLRPSWLRPRSPRSTNLPTVIIVAVDDRYFGGLRELSRLSPSGVMAISYMTMSEANARLMSLGPYAQHIDGAINVQYRAR